MAVDSKRIGRNIKFYRTMKGISQAELGTKIFVSNKHVSYLENGVRAPSLELLVLIANALDVSADDLLAGNLKHTSSSVGKEIHEILQDCTRDEQDMLTQILIFMKELFSEFGI